MVFLLYQVYGSEIHIFENVIPMSVRAAETPAEGISIYKHDPKGKVADAYTALTKEVSWFHTSIDRSSYR